MACRQSEQRGHGEERDYRAVAGGTGLGDPHAEVPPQVIVSADAFAADEHLRRRLHAVLILERVRLGARREMMVLDLEALAPKQVQRLEPVGTGVFGHHHAVKDGGGTGRHGCAPRLRFNGTRPIWGP